MTDTVEIEFALEGAGWADCRLSIGSKALAMGGVGYCTDALGDLVRVATLMATGHHLGSLSFDGEPREWRWILERYWRDDRKRSQQGLRVRVLGFRDIHEQAGEADGMLEFEAVCDPEEFARAVERVADRVRSELGDQGYAEAWGGLTPFPARGLAALKAALSLPPDVVAKTT